MNYYVSEINNSKLYKLDVSIFRFKEAQPSFPEPPKLVFLTVAFHRHLLLAISWSKRQTGSKIKENILYLATVI